MTHETTESCPYRSFGLAAAKALGALVVLALATHVSWNMAAPDLFGLPEMRLKQALGLVGIGLVANDELAAAAGLATSNGVLTDGHGRTEDPAIYAVGDVANALREDGQRLRIESWENAQRQAVAAAKALRTGGNTDLLDRLATDKKIGLGKKKLQQILADSARFVGAAPHQVDAFVEAARGVAKRTKGAAEYRPGALL